MLWGREALSRPPGTLHCPPLNAVFVQDLPAPGCLLFTQHQDCMSVAYEAGGRDEDLYVCHDCMFAHAEECCAGSHLLHDSPAWGRRDKDQLQ